jgi:peroxiredoxin
MALNVGDTAPDFTLVDTERAAHSLAELLKKGKTVLAFYPGAFTGVCTKEVCAFRDAMSAFNDLHAHVVGVSVDAPFANKAFSDQNRLTFPLLSDYTREVSKAYAGVHENFVGLTGYSVSKRAVFVIDTTGKVRYAWISESPGVEPPYDEIRKAAAF